MATFLSMNEWFDRITFMRVDNNDVAVQVKCQENSIRRDLSGTIWVAYTDNNYDKNSIRKDVRDFITKEKKKVQIF